MRRPIYILAVIVLASFGQQAIAAESKNASKHRKYPERATVYHARTNAQIVFGYVADALGEKLHVGRCKPYAKVWRICVVRIGPDRYRIKGRYILGDQPGMISTATRL